MVTSLNTQAEDMRPDPLSPYAVCQVGRRVLLPGFQSSVRARYCLHCAIFNVFGPRQDPGSQYSGVLSRFIDAALNAKQPTIYGDGEQSRDFTYIANV